MGVQIAAALFFNMVADDQRGARQQIGIWHLERHQSVSTHIALIWSHMASGM